LGKKRYIEREVPTCRRKLKQHERFEIAALGVFAGLLMLLAVSSQSTFAASKAPGSECTIAFSGSLTSLQLTPAGSWGIQSTSCDITDQSNGITSGTFTGSFTSVPVSGIVSGSWSIAGSTQKVVASGITFTVAFSVDSSADSLPVAGSALQGVLSGSGVQSMFTIGTAGLIAMK
jgi:hypothetical protein